MADSQNTTYSDQNQARGGQGFPADNPRTGEPGLIGKDDFTREYEIGRLTRGRQEVLSGNFADLQRLGAQAATGTINVQAAVALPEGIDAKDKNVLTPAQHDAAKGEWTIESERAGLVSRPADPIPAENKEPNSVDPGSQSPVVEGKGGTSTQSATKAR